MTHSVKLVAGMAGLALAALALTACDDSARGSAAQPPASATVPPSTSAPSAAPSTSLPTSRPSTSRPSTSRPSSSPSATASGQGGSAGWNSVDFEKVMFERLACPDFDEAHQRADVLQTRFADVTGDRRPDAMVAAACFTTTAANPAQVVVFDGAHIAGPRALVTIGKGQSLVTARITTGARTVTVTSEALSAKAPRCCPDQKITQTYEWKQGMFEQVRLDQHNL